MMPENKFSAEYNMVPRRSMNGWKKFYNEKLSSLQSSPNTFMIIKLRSMSDMYDFSLEN
jgi:hypothetical protein